MTANKDTADTGADTAPASGASVENRSEAASLLVVPMRDLVMFPGTVLPITVAREASVRAAQQALREERPVGLLLQRDPKTENPELADLHGVGTIANVLRYVNAADGGHHLVLQGVQRFRVVELAANAPALSVRFEAIDEPGDEQAIPEIEARLLHLKAQALQALRLLPQIPPELVASVEAITSVSALADLVASYLDISAQEKQAILETIDIKTRTDQVARLLAKRIEVLNLTQEIGRRTKASFDERQREAILREQMASIQRELGDGDGKSEEVASLSEAIEKAQMPTEVEAAARKELRRYERMPESAAEASMVRTYLDWLIEMPWPEPERQSIDIEEASRILEEDHFGLEKIKQRIIEYLAVRKLAPHGKAPILCFVGPPGVGKTSLGQSIARAMHRPFVRVSLGGVHDESEIRGHRRTYIGALPGSIVQAVHKAKARNCVMMLDEIDKMGRGIQGDPSAAMLEVLDPEQNSSFQDNYLGHPFDLSRVSFIATANMLDSIPGPLRDRMEIISLAGYTEQEKLEIARRYLVTRQLEENGVSTNQFELSDEALRKIIHDYTREAGVRGLEREIARVIRHAAVSIARDPTTRQEIDSAQLTEILGAPRFESEVAMRTSVAGVATGLAWTPVGGEILFIEATLLPGGTGALILTGQLGEVMRESAQTALSLVKNRAKALGIKKKTMRSNDIHIHIPAGATPKDGPSAGVALYTALVSLLSSRTVRSDTAMTGEISLRGLAMPVGGIKEKVIAADAAGLKRVMLPARNRRDYDDIPQDIRDRLKFIWLDTVDEAIAAGLEPDQHE